MSSNWTDIGALDDVPVSGARVAHTPAGRLAVFRTIDDKIFVMDDKCPHRGGPLSQGMVYGHKVSCAMHGLNIDLATGEAIAPDDGCVRRFPVKVEAGRILLDLAAALAAEVSKGAA